MKHRLRIGRSLVTFGLTQLVVRFGPALVTALGIVLVVGGLLTYDATAGTIVPTPAQTIRGVAFPTLAPLPPLSDTTPTPEPRPSGVASRIVIPAMGIDLPVVEVPDAFPYCNVAMWITGYSQPGFHGSTFILGHARVGMFLPLLLASEVNDGAGMVGDLVEVYTSDDRLYLYEIDLVARHQLDNSVTALPSGVSQQLVLTTSEGNRFHKPKVMIRARYLYSKPASPDEANPQPHIVVCY